MSLLLLLASVALLGAQPGPQLGNHPAVYDAGGALLPWTSWPDALAREVNWYLRCPVENGYPRFIAMTFMDGSYQPITSTPNRRGFIPAMQNVTSIRLSTTRACSRPTCAKAMPCTLHGRSAPITAPARRAARFPAT
ncbi:MAG: hypothetical protein LC126_25920 [Bryobacterales bacterium]|nr:hypothetical protein [Bryobacterales bacterium]